MTRIQRSTDIAAACRSRQRGFLLNPFRFVATGPPMALKTTGIATGATMILAVDRATNTVREWVSATVNSQKTTHANVAYGTSTWKSVSRSYFETVANGDFAFFGITFGTTKPSALAGAGMSFFAASAGATASVDGGAIAALFECASGFSVKRNFSTGLVDWYQSGGVRGASLTAAPNTGTTKFSIGGTNAIGDTANFFGLESGVLAADGTNTNANFGVDDTVASVGGSAITGGHWAGKWHVIAIFNSRLSLANIQSLHNDALGTLFDNP